MKYHTTPNPNLAVLVEDEGTTIAVVSTPNPNAEEVAKNLVEMQSLLAEWQVKVQKLERESNNYKRAYDEWTDKTELVLGTTQQHEMGMHREYVLRYKIGYLPDQWGERSSTPGGIPDPAGDWVRYDDHVAALASASQQAAAQQSEVEDTLVEYAMQIAHERELHVLGHKHDSEDALQRFRSAVARFAAATKAAPAAVANQGVVAWPVMPPSKGQSPILFEVGYDEGWAKCLAACKDALAAAAKAAPDTRTPANVRVNSGALRMALNVLRRAGRNEVADELEKSAVQGDVN